MLSKPLNICITGPESSGKSELTNRLSALYRAPFVPEFSRIFLEEIKRKWEFEDIEFIAHRQHEAEDALMKQQYPLAFYDTDMTVIKVWYEFYGWSTPEWVNNILLSQPKDFYLLMDTDLPWLDDGMRTNPNDIEELFEMYRLLLTQLNIPFRIISGKDDARLHNAITAVNEFMASQS